jgi:hypothetical protein
MFWIRFKKLCGSFRKKIREAGEFFDAGDKKMKNRREFLKNGLRASLLSGLAFASLTLGWRGVSRSGKESSCSIDLPCRICSELPGCRKPEALDTKQKSRGLK